MIVRAATAADCDAIAALNGELGYSGTAGVMRARLEAVLGAGQQAVFVADDGRVIGWIHVATVTTLESEPFAEIRGLIVNSELRSRGIGAKLVEAAENWAAAAGLARMRVRSNVKRERARVFYERLGYRVTKTQNAFERELGAR